MIKWAEVGITIDNLDISDDATMLYLDITVPAHNTDRKDENGEELAGELLARRVKESLHEMCPGGRSRVRYHIDETLVMNDERGKILSLLMTKMIEEADKEDG